MSSVGGVFQAELNPYFRLPESESWLMSCARKVCRAIVMPFKKLAGTAILQAQFGLQISDRRRHLGKSRLINSGGQEVALRAADGVRLDGMYFDRGAEKTIVVFMGNCACYEAPGYEYITTACPDVNVLFFNPRHVGDSDNVMATHDGLVMDGDAAFQFARSKGVAEDKIILHGHSLGGGIASEVAALHPNVNVIADRTFSTLTKEVREICGCFFGSIAVRLIFWLGWEFNTAANLRNINGRKMVLTSEYDEVIAPNARLNNGGLEEDTTLFLTGYRGISNHCRPLLNSDEIAMYKSFVNRV